MFPLEECRRFVLFFSRSLFVTPSRSCPFGIVTTIWRSSSSRFPTLFGGSGKKKAERFFFLRELPLLKQKTKTHGTNQKRMKLFFLLPTFINSTTKAARFRQSNFVRSRASSRVRYIVSALAVVSGRGFVLRMRNVANDLSAATMCAPALFISFRYDKCDSVMTYPGIITGIPGG